MRSKIEAHDLLAMLLLAATVSTACGRGDRGVIRTIKGGVEIVENGSGIHAVEGEPRALSLREEFRIDLEHESLGAAGLTDIDNLDVDSRGRIYVFRRAAASGNTVFEFDDRGRLVRSFARIGQGPGEVQHPQFGRITLQDEIPVVDLNGRKVLFFDAEGQVVRTVALPTIFFPLPHGFLPLANGDYVITYIRVKPETLEYSEYGVGLFGPDFTKRRDLRVYPVPASDKLQNIFADFPVVAASRTSVFLTSWASAREIEAYDPEGRLVRRILADYPAADVPTGFRDDLLGPLPSDHPYRRTLTLPRTFPPFQALCTDDSGRLYAIGFGKDPATGANVCDVFSTDGTRVLRTALGYRKLGLGYPPPDVVVKNDRLYCVREKPSGFAEALVFSLHWMME